MIVVIDDLLHTTSVIVVIDVYYTTTSVIVAIDIYYTLHIRSVIVIIDV